MPNEDRGRVENLLRRIEELVSELEQLSDPVAREHAREMLQAVLDLHGLALARMVALAAQAERGGPDLLGALGGDEQVRAVLLLHGLHPEDLETRVQRAVEGLRASMQGQDAHIELAGVFRRSVRLRVHASNADHTTAAALRQEIEAALLEAAPELEAIDMQFEESHSRPDALAARVG